MSHDDLQDALSGVVRTCVNGTVRYQNQDGQYHRTNGPAVIYSDGNALWYQNGQLHRTDGPAVIYRDYLGWFIQGREYTAAEFIEQQRNAGILLPALKDSYWFSQIPECQKG